MDQIIENQSGRLFSIGQVTALTGVGKSTLRHWEREFHDFLNSVRTRGNQRRFTPDAVEKIEKIKELVEEHGLTLRGVRKRLESVNEDQKPVETESKPESHNRLEQLADLMSEHIIRRLFEER